MARKPDRALVVLPQAPDGSSDAADLGIRVRNEATLTGRCVCGGVAGELVEIEPGVCRVAIAHEPGCPAVAPETLAAIRERSK